MKKTLCIVISMILSIGLLACSKSDKTYYTQQDVNVLFINVGRADAMLIFVDGKNYMIDTGEEETAYRLLAAANYMGIESLDGLILTHTHSDHIGGAEILNAHMQIDKLYCAEISENKENGENKIDNIAVECSLEQIKLNAGDKIPLHEGLSFEVLAPLEYNFDDDNDNSLVLKLNINGKTLLFTGDMQFDEELTLLNSSAKLKADVLKVGNHGNKDATSEQFAQAVSPEYAIITTDTDTDTDSAHDRVKKALFMADIMVTGDYELGIVMTVSKDGQITFKNAQMPIQESVKNGLFIADTDASNQTVTIHNGTNTEISLGSYMLMSENGNELFVFPENAVIEAGKSVVVACEGYEGDYTFEGEKKAWNKKKGDTAILYDSFANEISRMVVEAVS